MMSLHSLEYQVDRALAREYVRMDHSDDLVKIYDNGILTKTYPGPVTQVPQRSVILVTKQSSNLGR